MVVSLARLASITIWCDICGCSAWTGGSSWSQLFTENSWGNSIVAIQIGLPVIRLDTYIPMCSAIRTCLQVGRWCLICCIVLANESQAIGFCILDVPNQALPALYLRVIFLETAQTALFEERNMEMFSSWQTLVKHKAAHVWSAISAVTHWGGSEQTSYLDLYAT